MVIANLTKSDFQTLSAVLVGKAGIKEVIDKTLERRRLYQKKTILFVKDVLEALNWRFFNQIGVRIPRRSRPTHSFRFSLVELSCLIWHLYTQAM
jgi:hypothetical protein